MLTLDELKKQWEGKQCVSNPETYQKESLEKVIRSRVRKHTSTSFQYFWASFALQILVYSMLSHIIIKYWQDSEIRYSGMACALLFLPFTIMLMQKFKRMAVTKPSIEENTGQPLYNYVLYQQTLLRGFYKFKKTYELFLVPMSSATGVYLTFKLFVPGGVYENWTGAIVVFIVTLMSCVVAIRSENKKSFEDPIRQLQNILNEFNQET